MDPTFSREVGEYRATVREFLRARLPAGWQGIGALRGDERDRFVARWRSELHEAGYLAPGWPAEYGGGGLSSTQQVVLAEEFAAAGVPTGGFNDLFGIQMLGNTLLEWGTDAQKDHLIPRILSGQDTWCQGYSEPDAGSDLSSIGLRAELDGDEWVLNGQKIWTTSAHLADHIFTLARTDPTASRHAGISFLLVPMDQPGIDVRPIATLNGDSEFNEVFYTDARTAKDNVVGGVNNGWAVAMSLLGFERGEAAATLPLRMSAELDRLIELARRSGRTDDPILRDRLARCHSRVQILRYVGMRTLTRFLAGEQPGPDAAISKLLWTEYHRHVTELSLDILGAAGTVWDGPKPASVYGPDDHADPHSASSWIGTFLNARSGTIYAGSSEIQRNIIGEMILGLPKQPRGTGADTAQS